MSPLDRRDFVRTGATAALGASLAPSRALGSWTRNGPADRLRLGFIGVGGRGSWLMGLALRRTDCDVTAVCDINLEAADRAATAAREAGRDEPALYTAGEEDWRNLLTRDDVDAVIVATPWLWHTPMAVAAMEAGKAVGVEVPAATTVEDCWELVHTHERTGVPCMMLENVCYRRDVMAVLRMVREGLFGELVHCHCGYQHDLRAVKFNPGAEFGPGASGEAVWRTQHSITRNGELYPTHGIGPVGNWLGINRGNRFLHLTSTATKARGLHEYVVAVGGEDHPNADVRFKLGDVVTTVITTANGESIVLSHDTNLPRPYSLNFRVQGTRGLWMADNRSIYLEDSSPEPHRWEPFETYQAQFEHPLWTRFAGDAEGAGHGGMDFFVMHAFVESVKRGEATPLDVYDAAAWSVIGPLSEQSIAMGNHPVAFPDFTGGRWAKRKPLFALGSVY
ncbi:MAG: Gfo/Idh/MocA family oxidoreductase [marine benthic group bacterium]|nr:Gfo/Idh/MocA family oxidoreductase [Candidatus Carthagonibacter metallireducens]